MFLNCIFTHFFALILILFFNFDYSFIRYTRLKFYDLELRKGFAFLPFLLWYGCPYSCTKILFGHTTYEIVCQPGIAATLLEHIVRYEFPRFAIEGKQSEFVFKSIYVDEQVDLEFCYVLHDLFSRLVFVPLRPARL